MRIFIWALRLCVFLIFVALAVRNLQPSTFFLFADYTLQAPLVLMLLTSFLLGVVLCALSLSLVLMRQRREVLQLSADLHAAQAVNSVTEANTSGATKLPNLLPPPTA
jgi:lipopolysaccharide assembly protein A